MEETNILVVDDEKEIADLLEIYLISDGFQVLKAYSAKEGLRILEEKKIDLVLLDVMMPDMDGIAMCRRIRETNNIPIIMVSAKTQDIDKIVGLSTGADDYVAKPFNPLDETALMKILVEPKNSLVKQYKKLFELDGVQLDFKEDALEAIAKKSLERKTGARGLRAIMEDTMMDLMYEIPSDNTTKECVITKDAVEKKAEPEIIHGEPAPVPRRNMGRRSGRPETA